MLLISAQWSLYQSKLPWLHCPCQLSHLHTHDACTFLCFSYHNCNFTWVDMRIWLYLYNRKFLLRSGCPVFSSSLTFQERERWQYNHFLLMQYKQKWCVPILEATHLKSRSCEQEINLMLSHRTLSRGFVCYTSCFTLIHSPLYLQDLAQGQTHIRCIITIYWRKALLFSSPQMKFKVVK